METTKLNKQNANLSGIDEMTIDLLSQLVPDQTSAYVDGDGNKYNSVCRQKDQIATTLIYKNKKVLAKVIYDYDSSEEIIIYSDK